MLDINWFGGQNSTLSFTCFLHGQGLFIIPGSTLKIESVQNKEMHFFIGVLLLCGHCGMVLKYINVMRFIPLGILGLCHR